MNEYIRKPKKLSKVIQSLESSSPIKGFLDNRAFTLFQSKTVNLIQRHNKVVQFQNFAQWGNPQQITIPKEEGLQTLTVATSMQSLISGEDTSGDEGTSALDCNFLCGIARDCPQYIRGHLLHGRLGGVNSAKNLFPITRAANGEHETIEKELLQIKGNKVSYGVNVTNVKSDSQTYLPSCIFQIIINNSLYSSISSYPDQEQKRRVLQSWKKYGFSLFPSSMAPPPQPGMSQFGMNPLLQPGMPHFGMAPPPQPGMSHFGMNPPPQPVNIYLQQPQLLTGPRGGRYYINSNGQKVYLKHN